jgi:hypothetical protein
LILENGLLPKKPSSAESGEGCVGRTAIGSDQADGLLSPWRSRGEYHEGDHAIARDDTMKHIDVDEFTAHPDRYLHERGALAIHHEGRTLGYYLPVPSYSAEERQQAIAAWWQAVEQMRASAGMSEDEFADLFDLTKPFPRDLEAKEGTFPETPTIGPRSRLRSS